MSFFNKEESYFSVLIDIGSGNLSMSLVEYKKNANPTFIYSCSRETEILKKLDFHKIEQNLISTIDECLLDLIQNSIRGLNSKGTIKEISKVIISLSSPWFFLKTKKINVDSPKPFLVTENYLKDLMNGEVDIFEEEIKKANDDTNFEYEVVENSIVNIKVNGYNIQKIIGQRINTLDAFMCISLVESGFLSKLKDSVSRHTHIDQKNILVHTFPLVAFSALRDLFNGFDNFILLSVSSEYSDVSLVSNGVLVKTSSFPSGRNFIIRQIANELTLTNEIAESSLRLFVAKKLDLENTKKIEEVIINVEKEWSAYFEKALLDLSMVTQFPNRVYVTSFKDTIDIYSDFIKLQKADVTADFRKNSNLIKVNSSLFDALIGNKSHTLPEDNLSILAVFWNKFAFE